MAKKNSTPDRTTREPLKRLAKGLPSWWYHDPGRYARELDAFWYSRWIVAARDEELPEIGDWRLTRIGTQSIVLLRDDQRTLRAFHNTCRHRGSILCTEDSGHFARRRIVCPYHAFTYDLDGRLIATPRRMATPDFDPKEFSLFEVAADTWGGFVFVNLAGRRAPSLGESLDGLPRRFARYGFERLRIGKRIVADVRANWKLLVENFSECFHCPPVHPELCRIVTAYRDAGAWGLHRDAHGAPRPEAQPEFRAGAQTLTLDGSARLPPLANLDESVRVVYDWLFEPSHLPLAEADLEHYVALWDMTNRQDARNCEWQQQGMHSREFRHGVYVPQEFDCERFARWVRAGLRAAPRGRQ